MRDWRLREVSVPAVSLPFASAQLKSISDFIGSRTGTETLVEASVSSRSGSREGVVEGGSADPGGSHPSHGTGRSPSPGDASTLRLKEKGQGPGPGQGVERGGLQTPLLLVLDTNAVIKMAQVDSDQAWARKQAATSDGGGALGGGPRLTFASCVSMQEEAEEAGWEGLTSPGLRAHFVLTNTVASELDR